MFLSPHKFIGGPGTPGVLVAKRHLFRNRCRRPGRRHGAVRQPRGAPLPDDPVHREEGGTPAIIESIRAGLVFQLKEAVGGRRSARASTTSSRRAIASWSQQPEPVDPRQQGRVAAVDRVVRGAPRRAYLHHNFVVALLNDLFGIQARGGCSCAGPYGHRLLGHRPERRRKEFEREIVRGCEGIKPGWVRVNFNYFLSETQFQFLLDAIHLVATDGWKFLPDYEFCPETGLWRTAAGGPTRRCGWPTSPTAPGGWSSGRATRPSPRARWPGTSTTPPPDRGGRRRRGGGAECTDAERTTDFEALRWFPLPTEVAAELAGAPAPSKPRPSFKR
jgi:hypothetical protein